MVDLTSGVHWHLRHGFLVCFDLSSLESEYSCMRLQQHRMCSPTFSRHEQVLGLRTGFIFAVTSITEARLLS